MTVQRDFFISYTKADSQWAEWIAWQLEQEGFSCVLQAWDFAPSQDFVKCMRDALESSRKMIAVFSDDYFQSNFAQAEFQAAFANSMAVPVRVAPCEIPKLYRSCIYVDLVGTTPAIACDRLIDGVKASLIGTQRLKNRQGTIRPRFPGSDNSSAVSSSPAIQGFPKLRVLFLGSEADTGLDLRLQYNAIRTAVRKTQGGIKGVGNLWWH